MGPRARGRARGDDAVDVPGARTATTTTTTREEDDESDADATARARPTAMKSSTARADSLRAPSEDDVALAYDVLDPKSRGFFTARDVRRVADAHGFADWTDGAIESMCAAFKPEVERRVVDPGTVRTTRDAFADVVARSKARARGA
jgi:hypothetical protein